MNIMQQGTWLARAQFIKNVMGIIAGWLAITILIQYLGEKPLGQSLIVSAKVWVTIYLLVIVNKYWRMNKDNHGVIIRKASSTKESESVGHDNKLLDDYLMPDGYRGACATLVAMSTFESPAGEGILLGKATKMEGTLTTIDSQGVGCVVKFQGYTTALQGMGLVRYTRVPGDIARDFYRGDAKAFLLSKFLVGDCKKIRETLPEWNEKVFGMMYDGDQTVSPAEFRHGRALRDLTVTDIDLLDGVAEAAQWKEISRALGEAFKELVEEGGMDPKDAATMMISQSSKGGFDLTQVNLSGGGAAVPPEILAAIQAQAKANKKK